MVNPAELLAEAKKNLTSSPSVETVLRTAVVLAERVNQIPGLAGLQKKQIVLNALDQAISGSPLEDGLKGMLKTTVLTVVPATLDIVVSVAKHGSAAWRKPTAGCLFDLFCIGARAAVDHQLLAFAAAVPEEAVFQNPVVSEKAAATAPAPAVPAGELVVRVVEDATPEAREDKSDSTQVVNA